eukprot:gene4415-14543_t
MLLRPRLVPCAALPPLDEHLSSSTQDVGPSQFPMLPATLAALVPLALYELSDAAVSTVTATPARAGGWFAPLADVLEKVLFFIKNGLDSAQVPYSYGFSIILLTAVVKIVTFPLTKKQVESSMAVQSMKPRIDLIKARFGDDKDKIQKETSILYEQAGVDPLAGCLPSIASIPIFIGLYSSLSNVANEGKFVEGFFWIPSLAGPTSLADRTAGTGTAWLFPLVDGAPPIGWETASLYLVCPVLLVVFQWISSALISPPVDPNDPNAKNSQALVALLPLMIGWFSLNVPSGLSLYYLSNTVLTSLVQVYLKKLGGATVVVKDLGPVTKPGSGRRTGEAVTNFAFWEPTTVVVNPLPVDEEAEQEAADAASAASVKNVWQEETETKLVDANNVDRRVKRKKLSAIGQIPTHLSAQGSS